MLKKLLLLLDTRPVSIERCDWLKWVGWLNSRTTEQNGHVKCVEYWIAVQARVDADHVVQAKIPSAIG